MPKYSFPFRKWRSIEKYVQYYTQINHDYTYINAYEPLFIHLLHRHVSKLWDIIRRISNFGICNPGHSSQKLFITSYNLIIIDNFIFRPQGSNGLRHVISWNAEILRLWVRITLKTLICVLCYFRVCFVLYGCRPHGRDISFRRSLIKHICRIHYFICLFWVRAGQKKMLMLLHLLYI
jgi:hypothetical protein